MPSSRGTNPVYSRSSQRSAPKDTFTTRIAPTHGSSTLSANYLSSPGQNFQTLYTGAAPVDRTELERTLDISDEDHDPKKSYQCKECGKGFSRPRDLEVRYCSIFSLKTMLTGVLYIHRHTHGATTLEIRVRFLSYTVSLFLNRFP